MAHNQLTQAPGVPFRAQDYVHDKKYHLLLAASGSVATIKLPDIISALACHYSFENQRASLSIRIVLSSSATVFLGGQSDEQPDLTSLAQMPCVDGIYRDNDEWERPWIRGASILHIELRRWADLMAIAPLSANTMAKMVGGICDSLLLAILRAWDITGTSDSAKSDPAKGEGVGKLKSAVYEDETNIENRGKKIIIVAPAMNTAMWRHPITRQHLRTLEEDWGADNGGWIRVLRPIEKELACGDVGDGAMHDWQDIVKVIINEF